MANFAIVESDVVTNVIVAASKKIAEQYTGAEAIQTTGEPWIGWTRVNGEWVAPVMEADA
jgi:hypothetical protein